MNRIRLTWLWMIVGSIVLGGCSSVGHQTHSEEDHAKLMRDMNDPDVPSQRP